MSPCRILQLIFVLLRGVLAGFRSRRDVALENLVLRHQLQVEPLYPSPNNVHLKLELLDERRFGNGAVHFHYRTRT